MDRIQFFADSIAGMLTQRLKAAGVKDILVVGMVTPPAAEGLRLEVQVSATDELIPGNHTYRLDGQMALQGLSAAGDAGEARTVLRRVTKACLSLLLENWRHRPVPLPPRVTDPEYEAAPFIVLDMNPSMLPIETEDANYEGVLPFRAYVQF